MLNCTLIYFTLGLLFYTIVRILTELSILQYIQVHKDMGLEVIFCWPFVLSVMVFYYIYKISFIDLLARFFDFINQAISFIPELIISIVVSKIKGRKNEDKNL